MKQTKNFLLLIGLLCFVVSGIGFGNTVTAVVTGALLVCPIVLFVQNLRQKASRPLAIGSVITSSAAVLWGALSFIATAFPQYLLYNSLGLVNTYLSGAGYGLLLFLAGGACLIIGSIRSALK